MKKSQNNLKSGKFLDVSAFARHFDISRPTAYKLLKLSLLPVKIIGKRRLIDCTDENSIKNVIRELPGVGHHGTSSYYQPKLTDPFDVAFQKHEKEQEEKRLKRRLSRLKKLKV